MKTKIFSIIIFMFMIVFSSCSVKHTMTDFTYTMNHCTYNIYKNNKGYYVLEADKNYHLTKHYFPKEVFEYE